MKKQCMSAGGRVLCDHMGGEEGGDLFEMPTGGAAIMNKGSNLLKLARKEQCLALLAVLRTKFKTNGAVYRSASLTDLKLRKQIL